jgi:uncharacterized protein YbaR (Trm112 family)
MDATLAARLPLVCPACRTRSEASRDMHTLSVSLVVRQAPDGDVEEGALRCDNPRCGRLYPIVDGIPLVHADLTRFKEITMAPLAPEVEALLAQDGPDDAPLPRLLEYLSIYLDAHWGDRAEPGPDGPGAGFGLAGLESRVAERAASPVEAAVELGCSAGRSGGGGARSLVRRAPAGASAPPRRGGALRASPVRPPLHAGDRALRR